ALGLFPALSRMCMPARLRGPPTSRAVMRSPEIVIVVTSSGGCGSAHLILEASTQSPCIRLKSPLLAAGPPGLGTDLGGGAKASDRAARGSRESEWGTGNLLVPGDGRGSYPMGPQPARPAGHRAAGGLRPPPAARYSGRRNILGCNRSRVGSP